MRPRNLLFVAFVWMGLALPQMTFAGTLTAAQILTQFNAVVTNNFSTTSEVEGRLVAGNINQPTSATFFFAQSPLAMPSDFQAVNAININSCSSCNIARSSTPILPNTNNPGVNWVNFRNPASTFNFNLPGGTIMQNNPQFAMSQFTTPLNNLQTALSGLTPNSTVSLMGSTLNFNVTPGANHVAVFDVPVADLLAANSIHFSTYSASNTYIINVIGPPGFIYNQQNTGLNFNLPSGTCAGQGVTGQFNTSPCFTNQLLWNFGAASDLKFKIWFGSVLAGQATVTNGSPIEGFLYAMNYSGMGELHSFPFLGTLPEEEEIIPEPSTWTMLTLGLAGLGLVGWRRGLSKSGVLL